MFFIAYPELKFHAIGVVVHLQIAHGVHHNLFDEGLHPIVVVQRGGEDVGADVLVHGGVLVKELLDGLAVNQYDLTPCLVLVGDVVALKEGGEVLWVATVRTGEGEEEMKWAEVLELRVELQLVLAPVPDRKTLLMSKLIKCVELKHTEVCS